MNNARQQIKEVLSARTKSVQVEIDLTPAAVLIPLLLKQNQLHLLLTERTNNVEHHRGQISFPGGAWEESDSDMLQTALRETEEEVGIKPGDVDILGELDDLVTFSGFVITPFVGVIPHPYNYIPSEIEIAQLLEIPLSFFLDQSNMRVEQRRRQDVIADIYFYDYGEHTVWGITARLIKGFVDLLRSERGMMLDSFPFVASS